jgi:hypothetical protein
MQAIKDFATVIGAVIGVMTAFVTLYAKFLDLRKNAARKEDEQNASAAAEPPPEAARPVAATRLTKPPEPARVLRAYEVEEPPAVRRVSDPTPATVDRVREMVKAPAISLMAAGGLSLVFNLLVAGYGYVDTFVTPLSAESRAHQTNGGGEDDRATTVMTLVVTMGLSVASAAAAWAGYNMLRLRSYWLSMAGSVAIMPGAFLCCFAGMPVGIWSLTVLLRPDVSASFR